MARALRAISLWTRIMPKRVCSDLKLLRRNQNEPVYRLFQLERNLSIATVLANRATRTNDKSLNEGIGSENNHNAENIDFEKFISAFDGFTSFETRRCTFPTPRLRLGITSFDSCENRNKALESINKV
jgi:hypothetical protein